MGLNTVGVVGLGDMGGAMVRAMLRGGLRPVVFDLRSDAMAAAVDLGAEPASSLADLASRCEFVSIVVLDDDQVRTVVDEMAHAFEPDSVLMVHSTVRPATVHAVAANLGDRIAVLDAPVSGGSERGDSGTLTVMIGGDASVADRCAPVLDTVARHVFHVGPLGAGLAAKIVNNLLTLGTYALQLEAMQLGAAHGLDEDTISTLVAASQGDSRGMRTWGRMDRIRRGRLEHADSAEVYRQISKDLVTAARVGGSAELLLPMTAVAAELLPSKLAFRDQLLDQRPTAPPIPTCSSCDQELAAPFRRDGRHPECMSAPTEGAR